MPTEDDVRRLGEEIERLRKARQAEFPTLQKLAEVAGVSYTRLVEIRTGYKHGKTGKPTIPSDTILERLAKTLDVPVSRFHAKLGRMVDESQAGVTDLDALAVAEAYQRLPDYGKRMVREIIRVVEDTVTLIEQPPNDGQTKK